MNSSTPDSTENRSSIHLPVRHNPILKEVIERVNKDEEINALLSVMNINAISRLGMTDHGPIHVQIVANIALKMLRQLIEFGIVPNIVKDFELNNEAAELIVVLGALLHDTGMSIHRNDHEQFSLFVSLPLIDRLLTGLYSIRERTILRSEILHAIISHRSEGQPLTLEAGIVRVADALDMTKGRSRIPFESGSTSIHSISAASIEHIEILPGTAKPIHIKILMSNSAGVFQIDELLRDKLKHSGIDQYLEITASIPGDNEKKLVDTYTL